MKVNLITLTVENQYEVVYNSDNIVCMTPNLHICVYLYVSATSTGMQGMFM